MGYPLQGLRLKDKGSMPLRRCQFDHPCPISSHKLKPDGVVLIWSDLLYEVDARPSLNCRLKLCVFEEYPVLLKKIKYQKCSETKYKPAIVTVQMLMTHSAQNKDHFCTLTNEFQIVASCLLMVARWEFFLIGYLCFTQVFVISIHTIMYL